MTRCKSDIAVAVFDSHSKTETAVKALQRTGFEMKKISIIGRDYVLGPLAATFFRGLEGALLVGGVSALTGALMAIGIPGNSVPRYETALKADKFMLVVHGDAQDIERAKGLLKTSGLSSFDHHHLNEEAEIPLFP